MSSACLLRSVLLATDLRTPGGAIPARTYRLSTFVGRRHPVMHLQHEHDKGNKGNYKFHLVKLILKHKTKIE